MNPSSSGKTVPFAATPSSLPGTDRPPSVPWGIALRTERPEAVEAGYAKVMGFDKEAIWAEMTARAGKGRPSTEHPYGTGDAAGKIVDTLEGFLAT